MTASDDRPQTPSTREELHDIVDAHDCVLVEFHTRGCSMCDAMQPVLGGIARTTDVTVATMNPRDDPVLVDEYDVMSVPKLLLFEDGDLVGTREEGFLGIDEIRTFLDDPSSSDSPIPEKTATETASTES